MKPPSRVRVKPERFSQRKKIDLKKHRKNRLICGSWKRTEQRNLLLGLRKMGRSSSGVTAIDFKALKEKIPKRTVQEVESMVEALKSHVVKVTVQQLGRQRRAALEAKVPIEEWSQLAEDMAGSMVHPVTSAFSQMMFLCSTEPRSFRHSDPPRDDFSKAQIPADARTIPFKPMPMPNPAHVTLAKPPKTQARETAGPLPSLTPAPSLLSGASPLVGTACSSTNQGDTATVSSSGITSTCEPSALPSATNATAIVVTLVESPMSPPGSPASGCGRLQSNSSILPVSQPEGPRPTSPSLRGPAEHFPPQPASSSNSTTSSTLNTTTSSSSTSTTSSSSSTSTTSSSSSTSTTSSFSSTSTTTSTPSITSSISTTSTTSITTSSSTTMASTSCTTSTSSTTGTSTIPSCSMATPSTSTPLSSTTTTTSSTTTTTTSSTRFGRTSKFAQEDTPRSMGLRCIVDFEKIYSYLSQVHKVNQEHCLTLMESAVVLDLLLSLPEELPLLDCVRLEQHMIQAYANLTSPVDRSEAGSNMTALEAQNGGGAEPAVVDPPSQYGHLAIGGREAGICPLPDGQNRDGLQATNQGEAAMETEAPGNLVPPRSVVLDAAQLQSSTAGLEGRANGQSPSSQNASDQSRGSRCQEKATVCPLNPFMVPLKLLARRQAR